MIEVKTLKEMDFFFTGFPITDVKKAKEDLKKSAINTIKSMDVSTVEVIEMWKNILPKGLDIIPSLISIKAFLIYWANLTKEDLR